MPISPDRFYSAHVLCDGRKLEEVRTTPHADGRIITCVVPSEPGKEYSVCVEDFGCGNRTSINFIRDGYHITANPSRVSNTGTYIHQRGSATMNGQVKPFVFASMKAPEDTKTGLQPSDTIDVAVFHISRVMQEHPLNRPQLRPDLFPLFVRHGRFPPTRPFRFSLTDPNVASLCLKPDEAESNPRAEFYYFDPCPLVLFRFLCFPRDIIFPEDGKPPFPPILSHVPAHTTLLRTPHNPVPLLRFKPENQQKILVLENAMQSTRRQMIELIRQIFQLKDDLTLNAPLGPARVWVTQVTYRRWKMTDKRKAWIIKSRPKSSWRLSTSHNREIIDLTAQ